MQADERAIYGWFSNDDNSTKFTIIVVMSDGDGGDTDGKDQDTMCNLGQ